MQMQNESLYVNILNDIKKVSLPYLYVYFNLNLFNVKDQILNFATLVFNEDDINYYIINSFFIKVDYKLRLFLIEIMPNDFIMVNSINVFLFFENYDIYDLYGNQINKNKNKNINTSKFLKIIIDNYIPKNLSINIKNSNNLFNFIFILIKFNYIDQAIFKNLLHYCHEFNNELFKNLLINGNQYIDYNNEFLKRDDFLIKEIFFNKYNTYDKLMIIDFRSLSFLSIFFLYNKLKPLIKSISYNHNITFDNYFDKVNLFKITLLDFKKSDIKKSDYVDSEGRRRVFNYGYCDLYFIKDILSNEPDEYKFILLTSDIKINYRINIEYIKFKKKSDEWEITFKFKRSDYSVDNKSYKSYELSKENFEENKYINLYHLIEWKKKGIEQSDYKTPWYNIIQFMKETGDLDPEFNFRRNINGISQGTFFTTNYDDIKTTNFITTNVNDDWKKMACIEIIKYSKD